ncbi:MAG TPA: prepilin-type N-terminal cleavage/methylation domain-containing protein [Chthoniobacteraceae bacterium]|nr:prepilin-type N-terminal cleavage/methylation domain-containing protein [Chthoniobacteraceae bacterium]
MNSRNQNTNAFSLLELLISIGIVIVLAALALPARSRIRNVLDRQTCMNNLRQIGVVHFRYAADHNGVIPQAYAADRKPSPQWYWIYSFEGYFPEFPANLVNPGRLSILRSPAVARQSKAAFIVNTYMRVRNATGKDSDLRLAMLPDPAGYILNITGSLGPDDTAVGAATHFGWIQAQPPTAGKSPSFPYDNRANALFADGHVEGLKREQITQEMCTR